VDILAFGPHPDDVELCAGGWLLKAGDQGRRRAIVDLTRGEGASRGSVATRAKETEEASRLLGLAGRENLGLPDTRLEATPAATEAVVEAIRRWRPRVVLGPCPADLHPDHVVAATLVQRAYYLATVAGVHAGGIPPHRPDLLVHYYGHKEPTPTFVVDVSDVWERRSALARCYVSQLGLDRRGGPKTNLTSPDFARRFEARFAYWGARIGALWGEPYWADRVVPIDDPVDTFRKRGDAVL
jgi:bacillithiol biosynthesis deacetylase BshB1